MPARCSWDEPGLHHLIWVLPHHSETDPPIHTKKKIYGVEKETFNLFYGARTTLLWRSSNRTQQPRQRKYWWVTPVLNKHQPCFLMIVWIWELRTISYRSWLQTWTGFIQLSLSPPKALLEFLQGKSWPPLWVLGLLNKRIEEQTQAEFQDQFC